MIREAIIDDVDTLADIVVKAWQHAYDGVIDPGYPKTLKKENYAVFLGRNILEQAETIFVFESGSTVAGFISGKVSDSAYTSQVVGLYIHPDYQNRGIGSKLLEKMISFFREKNCRTMNIQTLEGVRNNRFYEKHGGSVTEKNILEIGKKSYPGIRYTFKI